MRDRQPTVHSDAELFAAATAGGPEAFAPIVERYQDAVFGVALARLRNFHDAQDVAQQAFVEAFQRLGNLKDPSRLGAWLRSVTIHRSIDFLRRRREATAVEDDMVSANEPTPPERLERQELRESVLAAIGRLSKTQRETTTLFYVNGYTVDDVARIQDVPVGTIKSRLHDAREKLKTELIGMVENVLKSEAPKEDFTERVFALVGEASRPGGLVPEDIFSRVRTAGEQGFDGLTKALESPYWRTRRTAISLLTACISADNVDQVIAILKRAFQDPAPQVRSQAGNMISRLPVISDDRKREELVPQLVKLLSDPNHRARRVAAWGLMHHWPDEVTLDAAARTYLAEPERHPLTREWKEHLLRAVLGAHGGDASLTDTSAAERITKLRARLKSENAGVRCSTVIDLLHLQVDHDTKRQEIIPLVLPMLSDRAKRVRWRTAYELRSWAADVPVAAIKTALRAETKAGVSAELKRLLARAQDERRKE